MNINRDNIIVAILNIEIKPPTHHKGLTLYPLHTNHPSLLNHLILEEALAVDLDCFRFLS